MVSEKQLAANRRNARKSTGPKSPEAKARVAQNSTTHGIFCRHLVLKGESKEEFVEFRELLLHSLSPQDLLELALVDQIVSIAWRLRRVQEAEQIQHDARASEIKDRAEDERIRLMKILAGDLQPHEDEEMDEEKLRRQQESMDVIKDGEISAAATLAIGYGENDASFERLMRCEQRLTSQLHRCLRDLEKLRGSKRRRLKLAPCPFARGARTRRDICSSQLFPLQWDADENEEKARSKNEKQTHFCPNASERVESGS